MPTTLVCSACRRPFPLTSAQRALCLAYHAEPPSLCPLCRQRFRASPIPLPTVPSQGLRRNSKHGRGYHQHYGGFCARRR